MGCGKESPVKEYSKIILSTEQLTPGEVYCNDDTCLWVDPDLWDEPILLEGIVYGPKDKQGSTRTIELIDPETGKKTLIQSIECPSSGSNCGRTLWEDEDGVQYPIGYYLTL